MKQLFENWNNFLNEQEQHFDTASGAPLTDKGREMCAKNPECKAKHMKEATPAQHFDTATGAPLTDKGREMCAKNPQCKAKHMSDAAPAQQQQAHGQKMAQQQQAHDEKFSQQEKENAKRLAMMAKQIAQLKDNPNMTPAEIILGQYNGDVSKMPPKVKSGYEVLAALDKRRAAAE
jgi:hypothetical protein